MSKVPVSEIEKEVKTNTPVTQALETAILTALEHNKDMAYTRSGLVELVQELMGMREVAGVAQLLQLVSGDAREIVATSKREFDISLKAAFEASLIRGRLYEGKMYFWARKR